MNYPSPCEKCPRCTTPNGCSAWRTRYRYRQKQINAYARKITPGPDCDMDRLWLYDRDKYHRWLEHGPCQWCQAADHCDTPCPAYWRWWDARMEYFRRMMNA